MIFDDCQSSKNFEALKGVVCKAPCFLDAQEHNSILKDGVLSSVLDIKIWSKER